MIAGGRRFLLPIVAAILVAGVLGVLARAGRRPYVVVELVGGPGGLLWQHAVREGSRVEIRFIHSYEKVPVADVYKVDAEGRLAVTEARFASFNYDARDMTYKGDVSIESGMMVVKNIDRYQSVAFREIPVRVAETVPQHLRVDGVEIRIQDLAVPNTLVRIYVANGLSRFWKVFSRWGGLSGILHRHPKAAT